MKNLVIVMAGDESLHEQYAQDRDFELWICHWGDDETVAERYRQSCDRLFSMKGQKWALVREVGRRAKELGLPAFSEYNYVFLPDDDIAFPGGAAEISQMFELARDIKADMFQPAIANENTSPGWDMTHQVPDVLCRAASAVEIMMPGFSGEVFEKCVLALLHVHVYIDVAWGFHHYVIRQGEALFGRTMRIFILDETPALHTRPTGAGTSAYDRGRAEAFLNPLTHSIPHVELARFTSRQDAAVYTPITSDDLLKRDVLGRRMAIVQRRRLNCGDRLLKSITSTFSKGLKAVSGG